MTGERDRITFDVETSRVLQILSSEIYDSPQAFLRENVQNAYDAILMRCEAQGLVIEDHEIEISVNEDRITVRDDGCGMTEDTLKHNFWKAGSSGKKSDLAQRAGVIGTFGIGAMANFGVCSYLRVETRHIDSDTTLISSAKREDLKIAQDCVDLDRVADGREPGTLVVANLDSENLIDASVARNYLSQYVRFLRVPVSVNGQVISQDTYEDALTGGISDFKQISRRRVSSGDYDIILDVAVDERNRLLVRVDDIMLSGSPIEGQAVLVQQGGAIYAFRNHFGLAGAPVSTNYGLAGFVNLDFLTPTAGREALSRESIQHIASLVALVEAEASVDLADTDMADNNQQFQQYVLSNGLTHLARNVRISVRPGEKMLALAEVDDYEPDKMKQYYSGRDQTILNRYANEQANLFHISQTNPRRKLQLRFLRERTKLNQVPEAPIVDRVPQSELSLEEAMLLIRIRSVLLDDYLMPNVDVHLGMISHGVAVNVDTRDEVHQITIERSLPAVHMVIEYYRSARDVFEGFVKDFVRDHIYPHIRDDVPSSQKQGCEALYRRLKANKELFRLQAGDYGEIETLLADFLSGKVEFSDVIKSSGRRVSRQRQEVSNAQIGDFESELPDIIESSGSVVQADASDPIPPILRLNQTSDMKVLTVSDEYPKLNGFRMFLAVSDRMAKRDGEFLHWPHTTRVIWAAHRVTYIFTEGTGEISLYYDIELKDPLDTDLTGGMMLPTTTIVTKNRIYVPVLNSLQPAFQATNGTKEFYVRFDTIP